MIKKFLIVIIILWVGLTGTFLLGGNYYQNNVVKHPFKLGNSTEQVKVNNGDTLYSIIRNLGSAGKLNNEYLVKYFIKTNQITASIKPGVYNISKDMSIKEFINTLEKGSLQGDPDIVRITIPEGLDVEKIGQALEDKGIIKKTDFIKAVKEYQVPRYITKLEKRKYPLEGFLFPDTYEIKKGTEGSKIIEVMLKRFEAVLEEVQRSKNLIIDTDKIDELTTMASIIENEIEKPEERALAASVFYNRLSRGIKLESCATVLYALGVHKDKLLNSDLKVDSPYNTYIVTGMPAGPISSPGRHSIEAALEPDKTSYLYFVSRNDGSHEFNETFSGHTAAVNKYQNSK
jgi:UPF0755 protein